MTLQNIQAKIVKYVSQPLTQHSANDSVSMTWSTHTWLVINMGTNSTGYAVSICVQDSAQVVALCACLNVDHISKQPATLRGCSHVVLLCVSPECITMCS